MTYDEIRVRFFDPNEDQLFFHDAKIESWDKRYLHIRSIANDDDVDNYIRAEVILQVTCIGPYETLPEGE